MNYYSTVVCQLQLTEESIGRITYNYLNLLVLYLAGTR